MKRLFIADIWIGDKVIACSHEVIVTAVEKSKITVKFDDGSQMMINPKTHVVKSAKETA